MAGGHGIPLLACIAAFLFQVTGIARASGPPVTVENRSLARAGRHALALDGGLLAGNGSPQPQFGLSWSYHPREVLGFGLQGGAAPDGRWSAGAALWLHPAYGRWLVADRVFSTSLSLGVLPLLLARRGDGDAWRYRPGAAGELALWVGMGRAAALALFARATVALQDSPDPEGLFGLRLALLLPLDPASVHGPAPARFAVADAPGAGDETDAAEVARLLERAAETAACEQSDPFAPSGRGGDGAVRTHARLRLLAATGWLEAALTAGLGAEGRRAGWALEGGLVQHLWRRPDALPAADASARSWAPQLGWTAAAALRLPVLARAGWTPSARVVYSNVRVAELGAEPAHPVAGMHLEIEGARAAGTAGPGSIEWNLALAVGGQQRVRTVLVGTRAQNVADYEPLVGVSLGARWTWPPGG